MPRTTPMSPALLALLRDQDRVVTVAQLLAHGVGPDAVQYRVRRGAWRRLMETVVLVGGGPPSRRQLLVAATLWAGERCAVDGVDALAWYGHRPSWWRPDLVHVVAPEESSLRTRGFVVVRRARAEILVEERGLVPYVGRAEAAVVAARSAPGERHAIDLLSRCLQLGLVTVGELSAARDRLGDKWCRSVDRALVAVGVGLRSPSERDNHDLICSSTVLPEPLWNQWLDLGDGEGLVCADALFADAGMVDEVNGRKYHAWGEQFESTEERRARQVAAGLAVTGCTPTQLRRQPAQVLLRKERTYLQHAGRGMPSNVRLVDPPPTIAV